MTMTTTDTRTAVRTATVNTSAFRSALEWVAPAFEKDRTLPALSSIYLRIGPSDAHPGTYRADWSRRMPKGAAITLAATDRYRLHWATVDIDVSEDVPRFDFMVPGAELLTAAKSWPKRTRGFAADLEQLAIDVPADALAATFTARFLDVTASSSLRLTDGTFPRFDSLMPWDFEGDADPVGHYSPTYLAQMATAAAKVGTPKAAIHMRLRGVKPAAFAATTADDNVAHYSAILMPIRVPS